MIIDYCPVGSPESKVTVIFLCLDSVESLRSNSENICLSEKDT